MDDLWMLLDLLILTLGVSNNDVCGMKMNVQMGAGHPGSIYTRRLCPTWVRWHHDGEQQNYAVNWKVKWMKSENLVVTPSWSTEIGSGRNELCS